MNDNCVVSHWFKSWTVVVNIHNKRKCNTFISKNIFGLWFYNWIILIIFIAASFPTKSFSWIGMCKELWVTGRHKGYAWCILQNTMRVAFQRSLIRDGLRWRLMMWQLRYVVTWNVVLWFPLAKIADFKDSPFFPLGAIPTGSKNF